MVKPEEIEVKIEEVEQPLPKKEEVEEVDEEELSNVPSPSLGLDEDPLPVRTTPPLYTYSNPAALQRDDTPSPAPVVIPVVPEIQIMTPQESSSNNKDSAENLKRKRRRKQELEGRNDAVMCIEEGDDPQFVPPKSLLEQLLVEQVTNVTSATTLTTSTTTTEANGEGKRLLRTRSQKTTEPVTTISTTMTSGNGNSKPATRSTEDQSRSSSPYPKGGGQQKSGTGNLPKQPLQQSQQQQQHQQQSSTQQTNAGGAQSGGNLLAVGKFGKRKRQESEPSSLQQGAGAEVDSQLHLRPNKRKCSENAMGLIKACMEDNFMKKHVPGKDELPRKGISLLAKPKKGKFDKITLFLLILICHRQLNWLSEVT